MLELKPSTKISRKNTNTEILKAELDRRKREEKWRYYKIPSYLEGLARSNAHTKILSCPNKVGKSTFALMDNFWTAMDMHPYRDVLPGKKFDTPNVSWLLGPTYSHVEEVFYQGMKDWGIDKFWFKFNEKRMRIIWRNNSVTYFKSYDDRKNIQGRLIKKITIDEECPQDIWYELMMRFKAGTQLDISITATPIECEEWFSDLCDLANEGKEGLYIAPPISIYDATVEKGGHLDVEDIKRIEMLCLDDQERQVRMFGKRVSRSGRVLDLESGAHRFSLGRFPENRLPEEWIKVMGIDPHSRKPHSVVWIALDPKTMDAYVYDHALILGTVRQIVEVMKKKNEGQNIFAAYIDPKGAEGIASNLQEINWNYYDDLCNQYPEIPFIKSERDPKILVDAVRHRIIYDKTRPVSDTNTPHLFIEEGLFDLWNRLRALRWREYRDRSLSGFNEAIMTGKDDDLKALGYALVKYPMYLATGEPEENKMAERYKKTERMGMVHAEMGY